LEYSKDFIKREQSRLADPRIAEALQVELSYLTDLTFELSSVFEAWRETAIPRLRSRIQKIHEESLEEAITNYAETQLRNLHSALDNNIVGHSIPPRTQQAMNSVENTHEIPQASTPSQALRNEVSGSDGYIPIAGMATTTAPANLPLSPQYPHSLQRDTSIQVSTPFDTQHAVQPIAERLHLQQDHLPRRTAGESAAAIRDTSSDSSLERSEHGRSSWNAENETNAAVVTSNIDHEENVVDDSTHRLLNCEGSQSNLFLFADLDMDSLFQGE
jgi:hypothetical protein